MIDGATSDKDKVTSVNKLEDIGSFSDRCIRVL